MTVRRHLRPSYLAADSVHLWVVDDVQPVAALVDVASAAFIRLVSWRDVGEPPSAADRGSRRVVADGKTVLVVDPGADHVIELTATTARARPRALWAGYDLEGARRFSAAWRSGRQTAATDRTGGAPLDDPTDLHEDVISDFLPPATAARGGVLHV